LGYIYIKPRNSLIQNFISQSVNNPYHPPAGGKQGESFVNNDVLKKLKSINLNVITKPAAIVKRTIRGMLSHKQGRGAEALKKIRCYEGLPVEFSEAKLQNVSPSKGVVTISLKEISEELR
jgi:hypothetical protein